VKPSIEVVDYDPAWVELFEQLKARIWPLVADFALGIEHVGSTSVPGLAAKPIIDLDIVIPSSTDVPLAVERLAQLGYEHRGNLGIEGREAFKNPPGSVRHHLYVCWHGSTGLRNHLALRDYLRANPEEARAYGALKKQLALEHPHDIDAYIRDKTDFIIGILGRMNLNTDQLESIRKANKGS
jgi:GrpB-like predicted nucleotidyltransferase (UPF0157 family)